MEDSTESGTVIDAGMAAVIFILGIPVVMLVLLDLDSP